MASIGASAGSHKQDDMMQSLLVPLDLTAFSEQSLPLATELVRATVLEGGISDRLESYADEVHADMILIATHGREGTRGFLGGSVADALIRTRRCPCSWSILRKVR